MHDAPSRSARTRVLRISLPLILCFLGLPSRAEMTCFLPNGTDVNGLFPFTGQTWQPCHGGDSMCCRTNDTCVSNGLCHSDGAPSLSRQSCTDATWKSPACLKLCVDLAAGLSTEAGIWPAGTKQADAHVPITQCADGSFCCGADSTACCSARQGVFIVDGAVVAKSSAGTSSSTSTSTTPPTSVPTTTPSSVKKDEGFSPAGVIAGGVVGGAAGLALIILSVWYVLRRAKNKLKRASEVGDGGAELGDEDEKEEMAQPHANMTRREKYAKVGMTLRTPARPAGEASKPSEKQATAKEEQQPIDSKGKQPMVSAMGQTPPRTPTRTPLKAVIEEPETSEVEDDN